MTNRSVQVNGQLPTVTFGHTIDDGQPTHMFRQGITIISKQGLICLDQKIDLCK